MYHTALLSYKDVFTILYGYKQKMLWKIILIIKMLLQIQLYTVLPERRWFCY